MDIPKKVIEAANHIYGGYEGKVEYLGEYDAFSVFDYRLERNVKIGFPIIFLWDVKTKELFIPDEREAVDILDTFPEEVYYDANGTPIEW